MNQLLEAPGQADRSDHARYRLRLGDGGVKSLMLGRISRAVLHHADRAVLVVPSPSLAEQCHHCTERAQLTAGIT